MEQISGKRIMDILAALVAYKSISNTKYEVPVEEHVYKFISEIPYFKKHPELFGKQIIEGDPSGRFIPYALLKGNKSDTVLLSGHIDVVSADGYGEAEPFAFTIGKELEDRLAKMDLDKQQRTDMESGEWIWGRGAADMKGGIAIGMCLLEKYAELADRGELEGSFLFVAVADEESYSAGMRAMTPRLLTLKKQHDLKFRLLIDPEPAATVEGQQVISLGTVGKVMPCIVTQGVLAHTGHCYKGISALNMLCGLYQRTNGNLHFVDTCGDESVMPPAWLRLRDSHDHYDVSLPFRAYGYLSITSFNTPVEQFINDLKKISTEVFEEEVVKLNKEYREFKKRNKLEQGGDINYPTKVMTVAELKAELTARDGEKFTERFNSIYRDADKRIADGESYPDATCFVMNELLNCADIKTPVILIGIAPPYYPATHSDQVDGAEGFGTKVFNFARQKSYDEFGQKLTAENYFTGISDNSYTSIQDTGIQKIKDNFPLWGSIYNLDFEAISGVSVPSILYGPIGADYHQWTERVNKHSLLEVMPKMLQYVTEFAWRE